MAYFLPNYKSFPYIAFNYLIIPEKVFTLKNPPAPAPPLAEFLWPPLLYIYSITILQYCCYILILKYMFFFSMNCKFFFVQLI